MSKARLVQHPLVSHHLTTLRDRQVESYQFRLALRQLTGLVAVQACQDLAIERVQVETPIQPTTGHRISERVGLVPILRAGIGMVDPMLELIPTAEVWHLGLYRDEATAKPVRYYSKLVPGRQVESALILDPMLATGGSACMACQTLVEWGVTNIKMLSVIAAPEGIARLHDEFPQIEIFTCAIDERLNEQNFIVPGLGDAGDRVFNTV